MRRNSFICTKGYINYFINLIFIYIKEKIKISFTSVFQLITNSQQLLKQFSKLIEQKIAIAILVITCNQISFSQLGKYPIQHYSAKEYKAGIQNIDFAQNRSKSIFVANNLAILSYDGKEWERHVNKSGKKNRSLAYDIKTNRLYIGLQGEFGYYEDNWSYVDLSQQLDGESQDFDEVWDVYLIDDHVYFCTFQGIFRYDGTTVSKINCDYNLSKSFLVNKELIIQSEEGNLVHIKGQQLVPLKNVIRPQGSVAGIIRYETEELLFYNSGKITPLKKQRSTNPFPILQEALSGTYVNHVLNISDNRIIVCTQSAGVFIYNTVTDNIMQLTSDDGLESNACLRSFQDYNGNLWIGLQNGIALIDINAPLLQANNELSLKGSGYDAYETDVGTYYTTSNGVFYQPTGSSSSSFIRGTEGPAYNLENFNGNIYACHHKGLFKLNRGNAQKVQDTDGLWKVIPLKSNQEYAIGGTYSGLYLFKLTPRGLQGVGPIANFDESSRFFEEDQNGNIWVGQYYKGVYRLSLSSDLRSVTVNELKDESVNTTSQVFLARIAEGIYIVNPDGVYLLNTSTYELNRDQKFADKAQGNIYLLKQDKMNNVHIVTENISGVYKPISSENYDFSPSPIQQLRYSFNNDLLNMSTKTKNGVLFSANEGFIRYFPDQQINKSDLTAPVISKIISRATDSILYQTSDLQENAETLSEFNTTYENATLAFYIKDFQIGRIGTEYRYKLDGLDTKYTDWTPLTTKEYTNLDDGTYQLYIESKNIYGQIVKSNPIEIHIAPPWYRSLIAKILYALFGLSLIAYAMLIQSKRYKKRQKQLTEQNKQELENKEQEMVRIEAKKKAELASLKEEKMASELRHVNNLLAASTMNLVVKNEFIENIKENLNTAKKSDNPDAIKKSLDKIVRGIDTTLRLQEDWEQFEYHFDQVHGDFSSRLRSEFNNLTPNEQKLSTLLRLNLSTKEVANIMSISQRGVEVARYRHRKKLNLNKGQNLSKFILEY